MNTNKERALGAATPSTVAHPQTNRESTMSNNTTPRTAAQVARGTTYEGWTNKETWLVKLWLDNDQPSYLYWQEQAINTINCYQLSDELAHFHHDIAPDNSGLFADLLTTALAEVNWFEIAQSLISDLSV